MTTKKSIKRPSHDLITVLVIGCKDKNIHESVKIFGAPFEWADSFNIISIDNDLLINEYVSKVNPQVIISFGDLSSYSKLNMLPLETRKLWIHKDGLDYEPHLLANEILSCYVNNCTAKRFPYNPLVSVFTPAYNSSFYVERLYVSLLEQTYDNWEWVVYDDSATNDVFKTLCSIRERDPRVKVFRSNETCGIIGEVKRRCCGLASGDIFAEADHDDVLVDRCLENVVSGFNVYKDAGFVYTDDAVLFDNGNNGFYGEKWGFDYGSYRNEIYKGHEYLVTNAPSINSKTVRHIVSMPDHIRAWKKDAYYTAGGHNGLIHVADDYELCVRTFLTTRMVHVQRFSYIQYHHESGSNTHRVRNKEIQRLVAQFASQYENQIHNRFVELGVDDFIWKDGVCNWSTPNPENTPIANYILR